MQTQRPTPTLSLHDGKRSLNLRGGELLLLRGACGSGKSLWLKRLAGLEPLPEPARIERSHIGEHDTRMIFDQQPPLWLGQTLREELCFGLPATPTSETLQQVQARWRIADLPFDHPTRSLNRLQAARLNLAAATLAESALLLIDAISDGLLQPEADELAQSVARWCMEHNAIVVVACNRWQDWQPLASQIRDVQSITELSEPEGLE